MAKQAITLGEWAAEWFRTHVEGKLSPNTEGGYRNLIFNHIYFFIDDPVNRFAIITAALVADENHIRIIEWFYNLNHSPN